MATLQDPGELERRHPTPAERCETHLSEQAEDRTATVAITDPVALVTMARDAPVQAAREAQAAMTTLDAGFNEHKIGIIGACYASAFHMLRTEGAWEKFIKDPGWADLQHPPKNTMKAKNDMLQHVLRYVFRARGEAARRRVRVYGGMLQRRFDKGFKPEGVVSLINSQGIESLREEEAAVRKAAYDTTSDKDWFEELNKPVPSKLAFRKNNIGESLPLRRRTWL